MNYQCTTAAFTLSPVPGGLRHLVLTRPETAFYAIFVRQLAPLRSGFLQTTPRGLALAVG
jgi:hypothetical protein